MQETTGNAEIRQGALLLYLTIATATMLAGCGLHQGAGRGAGKTYSLREVGPLGDCRQGEVKYWCMAFGGHRIQPVFAGCLRQEVYERLIERGGLANVSEDRIPSDARVAGELVFEDGAEIRRIPLYEWARTVTSGWVRSPMSGLRLALDAGVEFSLYTASGRDSLLAFLRKTLEADRNIVAQEDWNAQSIDPDRTSVAPLGNRGLQLVLEIDKTEFTTDEPIRVRLKVANLGPSTLLVGNILPLRSSANPPTIELYSEVGEQARSCFGAGIAQELLNESETFVEPGKVVVLLDADLRQLRADVFSRPRRQWLGAKTLDDWLVEGVYQVNGQWHSVFSASGRTADIEFKIVTGTPHVGE